MSQAKEIHSIGPSRAEIIDRFGDLYWKLEALKPEFENIKKQIGSWYADHPADKPAYCEGARYSVQLGVRENRRRITDKWKVFSLLKKILGLPALVDLLTIPLKEAVDKHIPEDRHKLFLVQERTGPRTLIPVPRTEEGRRAA